MHSNEKNQHQPDTLFGSSSSKIGFIRLDAGRCFHVIQNYKINITISSQLLKLFKLIYFLFIMKYYTNKILNIISVTSSNKNNILFFLIISTYSIEIYYTQENIFLEIFSDSHITRNISEMSHLFEIYLKTNFEYILFLKVSFLSLFFTLLRHIIKQKTQEIKY